MRDYNSLHADPRLVPLLADYPTHLFSHSLYRSSELMHDYSLAWALRLLRDLDLELPLRSYRTVTELGDLRVFKPSFQAALRWLLEALRQAGLLAAETGTNGRRYRITAALPEPALDALRTQGLAIDPSNAATFALLDAAAALYPQVAPVGAPSAEDLLGLEWVRLWLAYFDNANPLYAINNWLSAVAAVNHIANAKRLRILELGAGAGSGSEILLQLLHERGLAERLECYRITEPNAFFRRQGQRRLHKTFADLPLEFAALDINKPWAEQGADTASFDLVYCVNTLHVAHDLEFSLAQARASLAVDGGWLIAGECLRPFPGQALYIELVFQILDSFTDVKTDPELRPQPGFLTPEQWQKALGRAGFTQTEVAPDQASIRAIYPRFASGAICAH